MERTLVMIRHAKAKQANFADNDFVRPLNEKGEQDAPMMGERLKKFRIVPDLIISSSAVRAKQTALKIAGAVGYDTNRVQWEEKLYHCSLQEFEDVIAGIEDHIKTAFIVAHNPGLTNFVNHLSPEFQIDHLPTCGIVATHIDMTNWNEFAIAKRNVFLFEYPKKES